jgi:ferredoxin
MIKVNKELCIGCGLCASIAPKAFKIDEDGKAKVKEQLNDKLTKEAINSCPVEAISK